MENACREGKNWQSLFTHQLFHLGEHDRRLSGIYSPVYDLPVSKYIHKQFVEFASVYRDKYQNLPYFKYQISTALSTLSLELTRPFNILDIGSGAGNSVIPLLELCPNSFVIAADLSVELLVLLREALQERGLGHRCGLLQLNVEELEFEESSFDIIVGAAVLHHLFSPEKTIADCARVLKKGGHAIFFEPFENGNMILRIAYEAILGDPRRVALSADVVKFLLAVIDSFEIRKGRNKDLPIYHNLDDKWLFTPKYFRELSERCNFLRCIMYPMHSTERQFENQTLSYLRLETGKGREALPDWAWKTIQRYDSAFSDDVKSDLLIEGSIIMEK